MQNKILFIVLIAFFAINTNYAAPSSSCDIDPTVEGFDRFWQKTKCKLSTAADKVSEFAKDAYNATREATEVGVSKTVEGSKDLYEKTKDKLNKAKDYVKDALSDDTKHKSSEETDDARVVPLAGDGKIAEIPDIDIRNDNTDSQKTTKTR